MLISKKEVSKLSGGIRNAIDGQAFDPRDNREGPWSVLKNDVYTLVRLEQERERAALEEKEHLEGYLSDISHQLKTPLTSLMLMTELMEGADGERQKEFMRCMKKELRHMEWLVTALLKMAKLDSATVSFAPGEVSVGDLLAEALKSVEIMLDVRDQRVILKGDLRLSCDRKWTAEALLNLLKNASEWSGEGSEILVDCGENPIYQYISVTDAGQGLSREQLAGLFMRYKNSGRENGYGIGLPLARSIMLAQNGDIEVSPGGRGVGATFVMKFYR